MRHVQREKCACVRVWSCVLSTRQNWHTIFPFSQDTQRLQPPLSKAKPRSQISRNQVAVGLALMDRRTRASKRCGSRLRALGYTQHGCQPRKRTDARSAAAGDELLRSPRTVAPWDWQAGMSAYPCSPPSPGMISCGVFSSSLRKCADGDAQNPLLIPNHRRKGFAPRQRTCDCLWIHIPH